MIRLQGGSYSNEGCVEVYCNGQWGTICDDGFSGTDARTICKQLVMAIMIISACELTLFKNKFL